MEGKKSSAPRGSSNPKKRKDVTGTSNTSKPAPSKNGKDNGAQTDGRPAKRAKIFDARNIRSQPSDAALNKEGELDLQAFVNAREFEIKALESSMRRTKAARSTRTFQAVPRSMRRRTASHNVKRIPKRLRDKARREHIVDNTPTVEARRRRPRTTRARLRAETAKKLQKLAARKAKKMAAEKESEKELANGDGKKIATVKPTAHTRPARPKIRRNLLNEPQQPKSKFRKRQIYKTWLPTHQWHAKRARMSEPTQPLWRFAIPLTPSEKCYRPTHRASGQKGAVIWDTSYMSTIGLYGSNEGIERTLRALGLSQETLWGKKGTKWRTGTRSWSGMLSKERKGSRRDIGPATIVWNPEQPIEPTEGTSDAAAKKPLRQVFVRIHPSCFLEVFSELLKLVKMQKPQLQIEDLRYEIGSIELVGPGSTEALLGVLHPYHQKTEREEQHASLFQSLLGVTNSASLPKQAVLAFSVLDPRLRYPPKLVDPRGRSEASLTDTLASWPAEENLQPYDIFSRDTRFEASRLPSQKSINKRKGEAPGKDITRTSADPRIPVMLLASCSGADGQAQGKWTLLAPWACILPLWYSLVHYPLSSGGNPRFGGLEELRQVSFEQGMPWFPGDFPATDAGAEWELEIREKKRSAWDRRPKSKRVEWSSLDLGCGRKGEIGDGLSCDYEHLFGLSVTPNKDADLEMADATTQSTDVMQVDSVETPTGKQTVEGGGKKPQHPLSMISHLKKPAFDSLRKSKTDQPPEHSLLAIKITFVARGVANTCARIYRLPSKSGSVVPSSQAVVPATEPLPNSSSRHTLPADLRAQWLRKLPLKPSSTANTSVGRPRQRDSKQLQPPAPQPTGSGTQGRLLAEMAPTAQRLAARILDPQTTMLPRPPPNAADMNGHPLCPDERDLLGFVTTGSFNLSEGGGVAIGSISAEKALNTLRTGGDREGFLCIVRNAGESIGWLARWEVVV